MAELLTFDEALAAVLARVRPLDTETVRLERLAGRVLAEAARASVALPPFPSSAMDGYAVRSEDTPGRLAVVARIAAGAPASRALAPGDAMGIATGGVVPEGADAVVPVEHVVEAAEAVEVHEHVEAGANVRPRAGDLSAGAQVAAARVRVGPAQVGALAAAGVAEAVCFRRPRVAVLTTGSELRPPGTELADGQIYEANGVMLAAQLESAGAEVDRLSAVADDEAAHRDAIAEGLERDVLVTSGGVSVGPHDLVRRVEAELGVEEVFWGVAVKPGKPVSFGTRGRTLVFGLPGNPVSSLVTCALFVLPALRALQGASDPRPVFEPGVLGRATRRDPRRDQLLRARAEIADDATRLVPVEGQDSHMIARAAGADALVFVSRGEGDVPEGAPIRYLRLRPTT